MKRDTPKDDQFKQKVREEFLTAIKRARKMGYTVDAFAATLGITRAALHKYVRKESQAIPSLRVLDNARKIWKIHLSYGSLSDEFIAEEAASKGQFTFRFSVDDITKQHIEVQKVTPKGEKAVDVLLRIDFTKGA